MFLLCVKNPVTLKRNKISESKALRDTQGGGKVLSRKRNRRRREKPVKRASFLLHEKRA